MEPATASYGRPSGTYLLVGVPTVLFLPTLFLTMRVVGDREFVAGAAVVAVVVASFVLTLRVISLPVEVTILPEGIRLRPRRRFSIYRDVGRTVLWGEIVGIETARTDPELTGQPSVSANLEIRTLRGTFVLSAPPERLSLWESAIRQRMTNAAAGT